MAKFGHTWWGENWLNSLSNIDYSNRLPRGRRYAGNGSVRDIKIKGNTIKAKVQGTRRAPYRIDVTVPEFSAAQKKKLIDKIMHNPLILSKLISRELPKELFDLANENNIKIFPDSWKDLNMSCSCPDWAVPCKHIASVIYIIANEIDKNPAILFQLHGLDIFKETENIGFAPETKDTGIVPTKKLMTGKPTKQTSKVKDETNTLETIDYSIIPDLKENILSILDDETIFTTKNFKTVLKRAYTATARGAKNYIPEPDTESDIDFSVEYEKFQNAEIIINNDFFYFDTILYSEKDEKHFSKQKGLEKLIAYIEAVPHKYAERLSPHLKALYAVYHFSIKLLQQSAYIPQILQISGEEYIIRQIPALINEQVKKTFDLIVDITPPDLVQITEKAYNIKYLSPKEEVILILSLFLDYYVNSYFGESTGNYNSDDKIADFFFSYRTAKFDKLGEKGTQDAIYKWLSKLYMAQQDFVPLIKVDEEDENLFAVSLFIENKKDSLKEPVSLNKFLTQKKYMNDKFAVFESLSNLSNYFEDLKKVIASSGEEELFYDSETFTDVLLKIIPTVKMLGINILLPNSLKSLIRPKTSLALTDTGAAKTEKSYLSLDKMLDFQWQIALGDQHVSVDEFKKLVKGLSGLVKIKDQYVLIDQKEIQKLLNNLQKKTGLSAQELLQAAVTEEYQSAKINITKEARKIIKELISTDKVALPKEIKADLRPYQQRGYEWLYKNSKVGFGSIIADDMGLGKTLQVIAVVQKLKIENKLVKQKGLVIVPTTLLTNWVKEIEKFAPDLTPHIYHGPKREPVFGGIDMIITTYGTVRSDEKILSKYKWAFVVIDEAQHIKNPGTGQTKAVKKMKAPVKIAMSGTPVENRLSEYWSIFDFTNKKYLGTRKYFKKEFANPIETERNHKKLEKFKKITEPFIIRRLKTDKTIINDLPDKIQNNKFSNLTKQQTGIYQNVVNRMMQEINAVEDDKGIQRKGLVLKLMTALKQICNHPSQFLKKPDFNPELSGKAMMLVNLLEKIYENNEKVLIFTQYKEMGKLLEKIIEDNFHTETMFLHGGVPRNKRDKMVEDFQTKPHLKTFILSIKAAGTGLNLTAANNVIHYDLWWNPAVENQATDRAFRIGQDKNVMVYRLITKGTFEEKINEMLVSKKELADLTVSSGEKWIGNLSSDELNELVKI
jgi:SNF2 family DNA or RNA helicase/uncharacterized Zn finger protein